MLVDKAELTVAESISFEKTRFEYCARIYREELERNERVEKKVQFYLSTITLFLGVAFLKLESLLSLRELITRSTNPMLFAWISYSSLGATLIALLVALVCILKSVQLRSYVSGYPANPINSLFSPDSNFIDKQDETHFLKAISKQYTLALEFNIKLNEEKARWVKFTSYGIFVSIILLAIFLAAVVYLSSY